jgi:hypothetical protein
MENPNPDQTTEKAKQQDNIELLSPIVWDGDIIPPIVASSQKNKVLVTLWYMKKEAYATSTIEAIGKSLRHLKRNSNLENPENVKGYIAQKFCSNLATLLLRSRFSAVNPFNRVWSCLFFLVDSPCH